MQRKWWYIAGGLLVAVLVFIIAGCACSPTSSEVTVPSDKPANQDVVSEHVDGDNSGGYPATRLETPPPKYDSGEVNGSH